MSTGEEFWTRETSGTILLQVKVEPRSSRPGLGGTVNGALKVRLSAAPVDGKANRELVQVLAKALHIPRNRIDLVRGETGRVKTLRIAGIDPGDLDILVGRS